LRNAVKEKVNAETGETSPAPMSESELKSTLENFDANAMVKAVPTAKSLILKLEEFKSMIDYSAKTRAVYTICRYVQDLAGEFHSFYNSNRVICEDKDLMKARLCLIYAVKTVLKNALDILGVTAPEKM
jgi:arginyl-tRNA synthetase